MTRSSRMSIIRAHPLRTLMLVLFTILILPL
jgi:hypothetical protein